MKNKNMYFGLGLVVLTGIVLYYWENQNDAATEKDFDEWVKKCRSLGKNGCDLFDVPLDKNTAIIFNKRFAEMRANYPKKITKAEHKEIIDLMTTKKTTPQQNARFVELVSRLYTK
jgi:hypothetical protein